jgi:outer membrane protein TolC
LDAITLVSRPELRGQSYQKRIAKWGVKTAVLQALPGITLNPGWNYNSNKFLVNRMWIDKSVDVAWNLLNLASLPSAYDSAEAQLEYEKLKQMALTLTVLTQTRYAYSQYQNLITEYDIAHKQTANSNALYRLLLNKNEASLASQEQVVTAKLKAITSKMDENLLISDISTSLGELYLSTGFDILPYGVSNEPIPVIAKKIRQHFTAQRTMDFNAYVNTTYKRLFSSRTKVAKR